MPRTDAKVIRLPHFSVREGGLYFLNSTRALGPFEASVLAIAEATGQGQTLAELSESFGADVAETGVEALRQAGIVQVIDPVEPGPRRKIVVLEPHCDDAALSIGGAMWLARETVEFTLVTLASRSNYTSSFQTGRDYFDRDTVTALRAAESVLWMEHLGGNFVALDIPEATLRYKDSDWSLAEYRANRAAVGMSNNRRAAPDVLDMWTARVRDWLAANTGDAEEIWIPLGAGAHSDHDLARNACLMALMQTPALTKGKRVLLYNDVPYDVQYPQHAGGIIDSLTASNARLVPHSVDVTEVMDKKLEMLRAYASQFKIAHVDGNVRKSAAQNGHCAEHFQIVEQLPEALDLPSLYFAQPRVVALQPQLATWRRGSETARRLRVVLLAPSGRWAADLEMLRSLCPAAQIDVFASPAALHEITAEPGLSLHPVGQGPRAWLGLAARFALSLPVKTVFVAGDRFADVQKLARFWPQSPTLVLKDMDVLAQAV